MKNFRLTTTRAADNDPPLHVHVLHRNKDDTQWAVHWEAVQQPDAPHEPLRKNGFYTDHYEEALAHLLSRARYYRLEIDWDNFLIPAGRRWVVTNECRHGTSSEVFDTEKAFDTYCIDQIQNYYGEEFADYDQVMALMAAEKFDEAWTMANEHYPDSTCKSFLNSTFGEHEVEIEDVTVNFRSLPEGIQAAVIDHANRQYKRYLT